MELQLNDQKTKRGGKWSVALIAMFRLALLVGPEILLVKSLAHNPLICVLAAIAYLSLWLSVDVWPFRVAPAVPAAKVAGQPETAKAVRPVYAQNLTKAQWLSHLFCRVIIFFALFHSKLPV
jgi:hypothetical protein